MAAGRCWRACGPCRPGHAAQEEHPHLPLANVRKVMSVLYPRPEARSVRSLQPALEQQAAVLSPDGARMVFVAQGYRPERSRGKTRGGKVLYVEITSIERGATLSVVCIGQIVMPGRQPRP